MAKIAIYLANGNKRTTDGFNNIVDGVVLGPHVPDVKLAPGLKMVDIRLSQRSEIGLSRYITACVAA